MLKTKIYVYDESSKEKGSHSDHIRFRFTTSRYIYFFIDYSGSEGAKITGIGWTKWGLGGKIKFKNQNEAWRLFHEHFKTPTEFIEI